MSDEKVIPAEDASENFADLLASQENSQVRVQAGQKVTGTVIEVTDDSVFVNVGVKIDGVMVNPVMAHKRELKVEPGEIVPVDIEIVPTARIYHKGEKLRIQIAGRYIREGWFEPLAWDTDNHGNQIIYTGGKYESFIQCPVILPKYKAGEYVYR